ncbi:MAG: GNAT family N-acetyltransferase [Candidatus Izemoplasmatales bacterium]|jgi:predicted GNAT family acetyltransferase|nr:GNAT family N-acetyltransferase [Candidatus Izemoplasmatales bacterium]
MEYIYEENRIYSKREDGLLLAEVTFPARDDKRVDVNHVYVDESLRGKGLASELMLLAYEYIKNKNLLIVAKCPYAISWFKKHEQYQDIVINVKTKK